MKRSIMLLFVLVTILNGCSSTGDLKEPSNNGISGLNGVSPGEITIFMPVMKYVAPEAGYIWEWQSYMREKHDLDIELKFTKEISKYEITEDSSIAPGIDTDSLSRSISGGGFVYVNSEKNLVALIESGLIVPVNEYISQMPFYSTIDEKILKQYTDGDDNIWAFPLSNNLTNTYRTYNMDWVSKWGNPMPVTTDAFMEYAEFVQRWDPDGNGKDDSYIQLFISATILSDFEDVFKGFGCYTDNNEAIGYNPKLNQYEAVILNENFSQAFLYIKTLYDEGLVIMADGDSSSSSEPYFIASAHRHLPKFFEEGESFATGHYLTGPNTTELIRCNSEVYSMVVLKDTENAAGKMEYFVGKIEDKPECYLDLQFGIKGKAYKGHDGYYVYTYTDSGGDALPMIRIITDITPGEGSRAPLFLRESLNAFNADSEINGINIKNILATEGSEYYHTDLSYSVSYLSGSKDFEVLNERVEPITKTILMEMLYGRMTIDEGIDTYRSKLLSMGVLDRIAEINAGN